MGFMDKARKMAEQAQTKLDEVQKQFNEGQGGSPPPQQGAPVEYDEHGRPVSAPPPAEAPAESAPPPAAATPPHGDPLAGSEPAPAPGPPATPGPDPATPPATATPPHGDPLAAGAPPAPAGPPSGEERAAPEEEDPNRPDYTPPKLSGGDPLAG